MRGKVSRNYRIFILIGITPAYAGKSFQSLFSSARSRDHPRLCGEKFYKSGNVCGAWGSPPPMRGKVASSNLSLKSPRITPAYAGKSRTERSFFALWQDHPRLCGEKYEPGIEKSLNLGSPPPMRGKGRTCSSGERRKGITPAYAGKSR